MYATATTCVSQMSRNKFYNSLKLFLNLFTSLQEFCFVCVKCTRKKCMRCVCVCVCAREGNAKKNKL